jgi:2-oxoglutarate/2-oxoacid ferredoxin oxidoreductase subunit alpha
MNNPKKIITDGSRIVIEALARAGADCFIGYPITPANLLYQYAGRRFPLMLPAPDEITTVQWMCGLAATGRIPVTATSFPGFALMVESVNMAFMMELPMVIVLVQRLGPATGTATCGAQGDLMLLRGMISGGHQVPVLSASNFNDCAELSARAVWLSAELRTPVVLLTSKEEMMTRKSVMPDLPGKITAVRRQHYSGDDPYLPYDAGGDLVPEFMPVTGNRWQVRLNASTHDRKGILQHSGREALENTRRLEEKPLRHLSRYTYYDLDEQEDADTLVVSWGVSAAASRDAVSMLRLKGKRVSLLVAKTLLPVPTVYYDIIDAYKKVVVVEENINAQFASLLFGTRLPGKIIPAGSIGRMVTVNEVIESTGLIGP